MHNKTTWHVTGGRAIGPAPFLIAGIINVTPDSFYDGGRYEHHDAAVARGLELASQGAHILDVGGESTRPGARAVTADEEQARVIPVIEALAEKLGPHGPVVSIDTYKASVAEKALGAGAVMVNDVSACRFDPALMDVLSDFKPGYVLMHTLARPGVMQKDPKYKDVVGEISAFFEERLARLVSAGLPEENIALDPGIGFGKLLEHNLEILRNLDRFLAFGRPVYVGLSNKSMWGALLGLEPGDRLMATQIGLAVSAPRGATVHRVHEVEPAVQTLEIVKALSG